MSARLAGSSARVASLELLAMASQILTTNCRPLLEASIWQKPDADNYLARYTDRIAIPNHLVTPAVEETVAMALASG